MQHAQLFGKTESTGKQDKSEEPKEADVVDKGGYDSGKTVTVPPSNGKRKGTTQSSISVTDGETKTNGANRKSKKRKRRWSNAEKLRRKQERKREDGKNKSERKDGATSNADADMEREDGATSNADADMEREDGKNESKHEDGATSNADADIERWITSPHIIYHL